MAVLLHRSLTDTRTIIAHLPIQTQTVSCLELAQVDLLLWSLPFLQDDILSAWNVGAMHAGSGSGRPTTETASVVLVYDVALLKTVADACGRSYLPAARQDALSSLLAQRTLVFAPQS